MKKRFLSLLCVLALCLGLLPVTALAAGNDSPHSLYVGNTNFASTIYPDNAAYWTSSDGGTNWTSQLEKPTGDSYIHYNGQGTLTLHNANIQGQYDSSNRYSGYGIYAVGAPGSAVSLTIQLEGTNTVSGWSGIFVHAVDGAASLSISGTGSLATEGTGGISFSGIVVQGNGGKAELTINNVDVTATNTSDYAQGILLQSADSSPATLTVNGGELTASGQRAGIKYVFGSSGTGDGTPTVTVSGNAIVRANGGISDDSSTDIQIGADSSASSGGIVFDGKNGTVYGAVTLQEDLKIGEGETLTISDGASLDTNGNTITVESGGKLEGTPIGNGTVKIAPTITTTESLPDGEVGTVYSQTLTATGAPTITWNVTSGTLPAGLTLDTNTGTISGTPTTANTYNFTVTATNDSGNDSKELTLTISKSVPTYTISANADPVGAGTVSGGGSYAAGTSVTLTATPNSGYRFVGWMEGDQTVSTDTTYAFQASSNRSLTAKFEKVYTVTVNASGGGTATADKTTAVAGEAVTLTATPNSGYHFDRWNIVSGTITIQNNQFTMPDGNVEIQAIFDRNSSGGSSTPTKTPSQQATDKIESAKEGSTVEITLRTGQTKLDKEVFEALAGRDVTLEISLPGGVSWTVNGQDIPENTDLTDLDLGVTLDASTIPVSVINTVTGAVDTIQLSLKHDGEFGFTMILSAPLGETNAGYWANLYYYNTRTRALEFQSASKIATDGTASFPFSHASDYAIVIDTDSHEPVELPFTDVPEGAWYEDAAAYVYKHGLMAGTSATTFAPNVTTSRAMIATILWRMAGSPVVNYAMNYTDVAQGQWCSEAIRWATSEGVVTGYGNGLFGTNDPITREQLATMLWRYAQTEGYDVSIGEDTNILSYTDVADLSEYAIPAMQWAVGAGIINGTGDGSTLSPQGQATRAQAAVMLMRFCEEYVVW